MEKLRTKARARYAFAAFLGQHGKRCTPERLLVLDTAMDQRRPFTAESLLQECRTASGSFNVCRATVFNTLPLLVQCGVVRRTEYGGDVSYEAVRSASSRQPRQILVCSMCGKVWKRNAPSLGAWVEAQSFRDFSGQPDTAVVTVYGECSRCRKLRKQ